MGRYRNLSRKTRRNTVTNRQPTEPDQNTAVATTIDARPTEFVPHRLDPLLSLSEAGRLVGVSHTTIRRWIESGILESIRTEVWTRVRKSDLIAVTGVAAFARKSPYLWVLEAELPEGYEYLKSYPKPRLIDKVLYYPVPLADFKQDQIENGKA